VQFHSMKNFCSPYEESKALADQLAQEAAAEGVPIVCLYPGVVYGPGSMTKGNSLAELVCVHRLGLCCRIWQLWP
jgi:farnesol dehydrogenase